MSEKNIHKDEGAELTDNELDIISGGGYGELLKPRKTACLATCTCGYEALVDNALYGNVTCPKCMRLITDYIKDVGYR